jgi:short-subunit dehydrogenase
MKNAVVTGASYGLGKAICEVLLSNNYLVYGISRSEPSIKGINFIWIKADLTKSTDIANIASQIHENTIEVLVNNAGTAFEKPALDFSDEDFDKVFGLNFVAPIKVTKSLFPKLKSGLVINISSVSDRFPDPLWAMYGSSKTALNLYFETIAEEYKNLKIINLLPSYIDTPLQHKVSDNNKDFSWNSCMETDEVSESIIYIIDHQDTLESGSRVIVTSDSLDDGEYQPEKLWVYNVNSSKIKKVSR